MTPAQKQHPSLETLVERGDLALDIFHPGGLALTQELAQRCQIGRGAWVLDVASGTGETACYLAESLGARVVGIDASAYMAAKAKEKAEQKNLQIEFAQGDAHHLSFGDNTFDAAISECTTCILDKERAIREMARVVKPDGAVGIHDICWQQDPPESMKERLAAIEGERPETLEGWKSLFEKAGLVDVETIDKSSVLSTWTKGIQKELGLRGQVQIFLKVARLWGMRGLRDVWESERIFQSRHTGYGIIIGRKRKPSG